jgi:hypothetical protein
VVSGLLLCEKIMEEVAMAILNPLIHPNKRQNEKE